MSIIDKMEKKLNKSLLLGFTGNDAEKLVVAQWLDKGVNVRTDQMGRGKQ